MRPIRSVFLLLAISFSIGCSVSHQPLSDPRDLVFDPALLGTWRNEHGDKFKIEAEGDSSYTVSEIFKAQLYKLDENLFLDLRFFEPSLPMHTISRLWLNGDDEIKIGFWDPAWFKQMKALNKIHLDYVDFEERSGDFITLIAPLISLSPTYNGVSDAIKMSIYLNAPADSIKGLARAYAEDRQAFPVTMTFNRVHTDD